MIAFTPTSASGQAVRKQWALSVFFQETGTRDARFVGTEENQEGQAEIFDSITGRFGYSRLTERSQLALSGWGSADVFRQTGQWNDTYGGSFAWSYDRSRFAVNVTQGVSFGVNPGTLSAVGLVPSPDTRAWSLQSSGGISYRVSSRTTIGVNVLAERISFANLQAVAGSQIVPEDPPVERDISSVLPEAPEPDEQDPLDSLPNSERRILGVIASEGLQESDIASTSVDTVFGLTHRVSERTRVSAGFSAGIRTFESETLRTGPTFGGFLNLGRQITRKDTLFLGYGVRYSSSQQPTVFQQSLTAGWNRVLRERLPNLNLDAEGGISQFRAFEEAAQEMFPVVDVGLSSQATRSTSVGVRFQSRPNESLGFGSSLRMSYLLANLGQRLGSKVELTANGGYLLGEDILRPDRKSRGYRFGAGIIFQLTESVFCQGNYSRFGQRSVEGDPARPNYDLWTVVVSYRAAWPRRASGR